MNRLLLFIPLLLFGVLGIVLWGGFSLNDPHRLPSALLNKPFPDFALPSLEGGNEVTRADILGEVALVNVWATWCPTCLAEHKFLQEIVQTYNLPLYGINYKDDPEQARKLLDALGNPYDLNIIDSKGLLGIDLGVYGAPETFVIDERGLIRYKRVGDMNERVWTREVMPVLHALKPSMHTAPEEP